MHVRFIDSLGFIIVKYFLIYYSVVCGSEVSFCILLCPMIFGIIKIKKSPINRKVTPPPIVM